MVWHDVCAVSKRLQLLLSLLLSMTIADSVVAAPTAVSFIPSLPPAVLQPGQSTTLPPLIAALTALREPAPSTISSNITTSKTARGTVSTRGIAMGSAMASPASLDSLRPAAAAALSRQHSAQTAPLTEDDIAAIDVLLSREEPPSRPYCYDTGLPPVPYLVTAGGNDSSSNQSSSRGSSMQSHERLGRLQGLGPLSWLARSYAVNGASLLKLRVTQLLQLILQDAISDSVASSADLPPNQVVTFASSNLTLSLGFTGVDWNDGIPADAAAALPHKGLTAVKRALEQLTDSFDPSHMSVSFEAFPKPRGPPRAPSAGAKQVAGAAVTAGAAPGVPPAAANMARRLLLTPQHLPSTSWSSGGSNRQRQLSAVGSTPELTVVYVRLHGMDPMNMTSLMEKLSNCSAPALQEAGPQDGPAQQQQQHSGRMPGMTPGVPLKPSCTEAFRQQLQQAGVTVSPGPAFSIAPLEQPQATIGLSVAIGITREQQQASTDMKASAWLNSSAMQDIMGTFNLTVTSSDQDYVSYLRDKDTGRFPPLSGLNLSSLLPLFQSVIAASRNMTQQDRERQQQQQQQQPELVTSASPALLNRGILAGIVVAVVASVGALVGVVVLLLRRRTERSSQQGNAGATTGSDRRRRRRPRVYHTKYLSDAAPVLGHTEEQGGTSGVTAAASTRTQAAAEAGPVSRHALERGDSVMSQVNIELDESQEDEDADSESAASTAALTPTQPQRQQHQQRQVLQQQQQRLGPRLERQQGDAGSGGSSSRQQLLGGMLHTSSNASSSVIVIPADAAAWDDRGCVTAPTVSVDVGANSRSLSPWGSQSDSQVVAAAAAGEAKQGSRAASRHRLSLVSQADQAPALTGAAAVQDSAGVSTGQQEQEQQGSVQQGQHARLPVAAVAGGGGGSSFSPASAFAAMDAQLAAAEAAAAARSGGGSKGCGSGGGSTAPSVGAVQPLSESCWHKGGHVSGFLVPEAVAAAAVQGTDSSSSSSTGTTKQQVVPPPQRRPGALVSPFAAAIQLANSVASDEV